MKRQIHILLALLFSVVASGTRAAGDDFPSMDTILAHVKQAARQESVNDRNFRSRYAFVRTKTNRELDSKGRVKKEETKRNQNNPIASRTSYVNPSREVATPVIGPVKSPPKTSNQAFDKSDFVLSDDLFSRFDFRVIRREQLNGRPPCWSTSNRRKQLLPSAT